MAASISGPPRQTTATRRALFGVAAVAAVATTAAAHPTLDLELRELEREWLEIDRQLEDEGLSLDGMKALTDRQEVVEVQVAALPATTAQSLAFKALLVERFFWFEPNAHSDALLQSLLADVKRLATPTSDLTFQLGKAVS